MRPASQRFFIHSCIYPRILIISYLATFLGTNSLFVLMCRKAVNQTIDSALVIVSLLMHLCLFVDRALVIVCLVMHLCLFVDSVLDTVSLVMHKFGTLAGSYLPRLLQIIVCVAASSAALLNRRYEIQLNHINLLKSLRQKALTALSEVNFIFV